MKLYEIMNRMSSEIVRNYGYDGDLELTVPEKLFIRIQHECEAELVYRSHSYVGPIYDLSLYTQFGQITVKRGK